MVMAEAVMASWEETAEQMAAVAARMASWEGRAVRAADREGEAAESRVAAWEAAVRRAQPPCLRRPPLG